MKQTKDSIWNIGQFISILVGLMVAYQSSFAYGTAVAVGLGILVDIRRELHELNEKKT